MCDAREALTNNRCRTNERLILFPDFFQCLYNYLDTFTPSALACELSIVVMSAIATATLTRVGTIPYYVPSRLASIPAGSRRLVFGKAPDFSDGLVPITVIVFENARQASLSNLLSTVGPWLVTDDVFNKNFPGLTGLHTLLIGRLVCGVLVNTVTSRSHHEVR